MLKPATTNKKQVFLGIDPGPGPNGGALVKEIARFGSFAKAGVQVGDEIVWCNGKKWRDIDTVADELTEVGVGKTVTIHLMRGGKRIELPVKLLEKKTLSLEVKALEEVLERKISPASC